MESKDPKQMANRIITQLIHHIGLDDAQLRAEELMAIRIMFRHKGGSWEGVMTGDPKQFSLLQMICAAAMPELTKKIKPST